MGLTKMDIDMIVGMQPTVSTEYKLDNPFNMDGEFLFSKWQAKSSKEMSVVVIVILIATFVTEFLTILKSHLREDV